MSLNQQLTEFRFNLETLDLLTSMGKSTDYSNQMLGELGLNAQLIKFMQSNRMLLNSVLLRLQLYSEQNMSEQKVRSSLSVLNNQSVHVLLDYLYKSSESSKESSKETKKEVKKASPPPTPKPEVVQEPVQEEQEEQEEHEEEQQEEADEEEESHFDSFFSACVRQSDDATHVVKMSAMYDAFNKWWSNHYEDEVPSKDELKEYLAERLGHPIKSNVSNVSLI
jgi:type IV secretory pathway VirB10-like protein